MNNQEKFTIRSSKLKVHRAYSQTISSYLVRFSTNFLISSLVSFAFFLKLKIYILIHTELCTRVISGNKTTFFGLTNYRWYFLEKFAKITPNFSTTQARFFNIKIKRWYWKSNYVDLVVLINLPKTLDTSDSSIAAIC